MTPLPIDSRLPEILDAIRSNESLVLVAPPGAGKTTRVPPAILRAGILSPEHPSMIVLQPRRVAARSTAARIAEEQNWELGAEVGYQVRFERQLTSRTRIKIQTEGVLTRQILADPFLESVGIVILDEIHERGIHSDLALALLKEIRREVRPDLKIVAMSATVDAAPIASFLDDCPVLRVEGRTYPVSVGYRPSTSRLVDSVGSAILDVVADQSDSGDVLVFLPGMAEIRGVQRQVENVVKASGAIVLPLHGSLPPSEQDRALRPNASRKIILSTNIAETSLTIDGVTTVIDCGLARVAEYDAERGFDRLTLRRISRASAEQRAGRAGRTAPGRCLRLWSEAQHRGLVEQEIPEIQRVDLCESVLALNSWGVTEPSEFSWYEAPSPERLEAAEKLLVMLGAIEEGNRHITVLGRRLQRLPVHPRLGRLLLAACDSGKVLEGASLAAILSEKDIVARDSSGGSRSDRFYTSRHGSSGPGTSDLSLRLDMLRTAEREGFSARLRDRGIDPGVARQVAHTRDHLVRLSERAMSRVGPVHAQSVEDEDDLEIAMRKWLLFAYPDRVVRRRGAAETGVMVGGRGVRLDRCSVVRDDDFFLAIDPREDRRRGVLELQVRIASSVDREWLESVHPNLIRVVRCLRFDDQKGRVISVKETWFQDLLIHQDDSLTVDPEEGSRTFATAISPRAGEWFRSDRDSASLLARIAFLRDALPDLELPEFSDDVLAVVLEKVCRDWGIMRLGELDRLVRVDAVRGSLNPNQIRLIEQEAPESFALPNGRSVKLTYEEGKSPILAVRLQELFGWGDTPRLARGRVPVLLHLLGPNYRPVQITSDLRGFWQGTYHQVRKDLRGRYPKHSWPEDPLTASPISQTRRR